VPKLAACGIASGPLQPHVTIFRRLLNYVSSCPYASISKRHCIYHAGLTHLLLLLPLSTPSSPVVLFCLKPLRLHFFPSRDHRFHSADCRNAQRSFNRVQHVLASIPHEERICGHYTCPLIHIGYATKSSTCLSAHLSCGFCPQEYGFDEDISALSSEAWHIASSHKRRGQQCPPLRTVD
jgi:hypothetical protein